MCERGADLHGTRDRAERCRQEWRFFPEVQVRTRAGIFVMEKRVRRDLGHTEDDRPA